MLPETASHCPRCSTVLCEQMFRGGLVKTCTDCQGLLLTRAWLLRILDALTVELRDSLDLTAPLEALPDSGAGIHCPQCSDPMEHHAYMGARWVMIDSCASCNLLWLTPEALGMMGVLYARSRTRAQQIRESSDESLDASRMLRARNLAGAVMRFLAG